MVHCRHWTVADCRRLDLRRAPEFATGCSQSRGRHRARTGLART